MPHITTCTTCGMLYEEISEERANAPARECGECWSRRNDARLANEWAARHEPEPQIEPYRYLPMNNVGAV